MRITHPGARALAVLIAIPLLFAVAACSPEDVAICQNTPGCVEAVAAAHREPQASGDCWEAIDRWWPTESRDWFRGIVRRESGGDPHAQNSRSSAAGCAQLLALHRGRFEKLGYTWADRYNPDANVRAALDLYRDAGRSPWAT